MLIKSQEIERPGESLPEPLHPLSEMLERSAERYGSNIALRGKTALGWREYTYAHLLSSVRSVARYLRETGHRKGDFVGLVGPNSPEWVISFMAVQWVGAVAVPLDPKAKETELRQIFDHSELKSVFAPQKSIEWLREIEQRNTFRKNLLFIPMDPLPTQAFPSAPERVPDAGARQKSSLDDLAIVQYTSGTTGNPKGVMLTHRNIASNIRSLFRAVAFDQRDRFFSVLPIHHVYEGTAGNWLPLSVGASVTYARSLKSKEMIEDASDAEPTVMLAVPLLLEKLFLGIRKRLSGAPGPVRAATFLLTGAAAVLNRLGQGYGNRLLWGALRKRLGFGKLRFFVSGGAALPPPVQKGLEGFGFTVLQGYGLSETSPVLTLNPPGRTRLGSIGLPIPGVDLRIFDPDSQGVGEIAVKGENVMAGYFRNEAATRSVFAENRYFLTGDMGYQDEEGFVFLTGRKGSTLVTKGGKKIFPEEIESLMLESPLIEEILVVKGRHPRTGEEVVQALIYPNRDAVEARLPQGGTLLPEQREEAFRNLLQVEIDERSKKLAPYKRIVHFKVRDEEFPKTSTNKIKRYLFEGESSGKAG